MVEEAAKNPIRFVVTVLDGKEVVYPPVAIEDAGGNRVRIVNLLDKEVSVTHHGKLDTGEDPIKLSPRGSGPSQKTFTIDADADKAGSSFNLTFTASPITAFGRVGDPTIIIL